MDMMKDMCERIHDESITNMTSSENRNLLNVYLTHSWTFEFYSKFTLNYVYLISCFRPIVLNFEFLRALQVRLRR